MAVRPSLFDLFPTEETPVATPSDRGIDDLGSLTSYTPGTSFTPGTSLASLPEFAPLPTHGDADDDYDAGCRRNRAAQKHAAGTGVHAIRARFVSTDDPSKLPLEFIKERLPKLRAAMRTVAPGGPAHTKLGSQVSRLQGELQRRALLSKNSSGSGSGGAEAPSPATAELAQVPSFVTYDDVSDIARGVVRRAVVAAVHATRLADVAA